MNIRRRGVLVLGAVSLASATVGCGQLIHGREIPEYLSDFDGVTSVEKVDTEHWYYAWNVTLENDPPWSQFSRLFAVLLISWRAM